MVPNRLSAKTDNDVDELNWARTCPPDRKVAIISVSKASEHDALRYHPGVITPSFGNNVEFNTGFKSSRWTRNILD